MFVRRNEAQIPLVDHRGALQSDRLSVRAPVCPAFEERGKENPSINLDFFGLHHTPRLHSTLSGLPSMNAEHQAKLGTVTPQKHLSATIMFVSLVSQWLRKGPALRCFLGNTRLHCQLDVNGVQAAGVKEQLMESVVLFLLI